MNASVMEQTFQFVGKLLSSQKRRIQVNLGILTSSLPAVIFFQVCSFGSGLLHPIY